MASKESCYVVPTLTGYTAVWATSAIEAREIAHERALAKLMGKKGHANADVPVVGSSITDRDPLHTTSREGVLRTR